jgi:hypothetical protein
VEHRCVRIRQTVLLYVAGWRDSNKK